MDYLPCPEVDLGEWYEKLLASLQGRRYPFSGEFELTERCNLTCVHCYINQPAANREVKARELATTQVMGILDQIAEAGCLFLLFTGGEVLLRSDFSEIYRHAQQRGILISLFTNGTLVTPRIADLLAEWRPLSVEITLYGATQETYERVTQVPGSYAHCRQGIELLLERGLPFSLKSVMLTVNRHELSGMRALAEQLGLPFRFDGMLWPRLDGSQGPLEYRLSLEDVSALDQVDARKMGEWAKKSGSFSGKLVRNEYVYSCEAGFRSFHVNSAGRMSICGMSRRTDFDLMQMNFLQAWDRLGDLRTTKRQLDTACRTCTIGPLCVQCPGWSQAIHGDDETPVEFVCALGHLRAELIQHPT